MKKRNKILLSILVVFILFTITISAFIVNFIFSNKEYYKNEKNIYIPIFVYHEIVKEKTAEDFMQTTDVVFRKQITGLLKLGYEFISYDDLIAYNNGLKKLKSKVVLVTFDDGFSSNYDVLFPIIKELNIPITINVIDNTIGTEHFLSWDQIKEMYNSGLVSIHSHGRIHVNSAEFETNQYAQDVLSAHTDIENNLGKSISKVFTYPYGLYQEEKIAAISELGFVQNLTDNKINESKTLDMSRLHRCYPLSDSTIKMLIKILYRDIRYNR